MNQKLVRFRVCNFRSIQDSGWIRLHDINGFVGTNESGKTNLLIALWKLKPANGEPISMLRDFPRKEYANVDASSSSKVFVIGEFFMSNAIIDQFFIQTGFQPELCSRVLVGRRFDGSYTFHFPLRELWEGWVAIKNYFEHIVKKFPGTHREKAGRLALEEIEDRLESPSELKLSDFQLVSDIVDEYESQQEEDDRITRELTDLRYAVERTAEYYVESFRSIDKPELKKLILQELPNFVYYSDYGNIDTEIYLPSILNNLERKDLGEKEEAKVRTLNILFDFVGLNPRQILELGVENQDGSNVKKEADQKKKREILLQNASTSLTDRFQEWWKQGRYTFRFQADGNHFRIWVSDQLRQEQIELDARSRGLQWFFSFFLTFWVETQGAYANSILLLDEAGFSLHPKAQKDLIDFLYALAENNQILYTTHSPFMLHSDRLHRVRAVYVDQQGYTQISTDLSAGMERAQGSLYAIHAAIGLDLVSTLLPSAKPVLAEGVGTHLLLQYMKSVLLSTGKINLNKDILFLQAEQANGVGALVRVLQMGEPPCILARSTSESRNTIASLRGDLYAQWVDKIRFQDQFVGFPEGGIEDLLPSDVLSREFARLFRPDAQEAPYFDECYNSTSPFLSQANTYANSYGLKLPLHWEMVLYKKVIAVLQAQPQKITDEILQRWVGIFDFVLSDFAPDTMEILSLDEVRNDQEEELPIEPKAMYEGLKSLLQFMEEELEDAEGAEADALSKDISKLLKSAEKSGDHFKDLSISTFPQRLRKLVKASPSLKIYLDPEDFKRFRKLANALLEHI